MNKPDWIAVDWGTTHLRAWALSNTGEIIGQGQSAKGMGVIERGGFEPALLDLIDPWLSTGPIPVLACGMVGSRQGWAEASYNAAPFKPSEAQPTRVAAWDARIDVHILPGISQKTPADVMRGEETQILGALAEFPEFDGVICLPGTHTKWAHISAEEIVSFQTSMTGELFSLLSGQSVLRHSVDGDDLDLDSFDEALSETLSRPEKLAQKLFQLRAEDLLNNQNSAVARGRLSGLLIGAELASTRAYWLGQKVLLGGASELTALYVRGLATQGVETMERGGDILTLAGLARAYQSLMEKVT